MCITLDRVHKPPRKGFKIHDIINVHSMGSIISISEYAFQVVLISDVVLMFPKLMPKLPITE